MVVFRFRSLESDKARKNAFDIIKNQRLYLADWQQMNDPAEGFFYLSHSKNADTIINEKLKFRVCSFSKYYTNALLWSYYADGFKGICVAIEIPDQELHTVRYLRRSPEYSTYDTRIPSELAVDALTSKLDYWKHEAELRLLCKDSDLLDSKYRKSHIAAVFYGSLISEDDKRDLLNLCGDIPTAEASIQSDSCYSKCEGFSNNVSLSKWENRPSESWTVFSAASLHGWMHQGERSCQICKVADIKNEDDPLRIEDFLEDHYLDSDFVFKHAPRNTALLCPSCHRRMHLDSVFEATHIDRLKELNFTNR